VRFIQFLPLTAFVATARLKGLGPEAWGLAFEVGGLLAVVETAILIWKRVTLNRLLLGANVFLMVGALGFGLQIPFIVSLYGRTHESALFGAVFVVGLLTTFFTTAGFIEMPSLDRKTVVRRSGALLVVTAICMTLSIALKGNVMLGGTLPFVLLIVARQFLRRSPTMLP
jgi:hypothetical protein